MAERWYCPDQVFDGQTLRDDLALCVAGGVVQVRPRSAAPSTAARIAGTVTPGFVDLQVNGGGGVLLNATPTADGMSAIATAHRGLGTAAILPTVITDAPEVLAAAVEAALAAQGRPGIAGLHIEGPHIALARRGTHAPTHVRPMEPATLAHVRRLRDAGIPVMITLAPEAAGPDQIAALAATGAVVSIGHSDATAPETRAALAAGARCFTHLFNAMSPMLNRLPGVVGAAINSDAHAGIIADGHHVADEMVALAIRARPVADRMFLVSDAMPTVGGPDRFILYGRELMLHEGRLVNSEGSLAGAHITQAQGVARLVHEIGLPLQQALRMAVTVPCAVMGLPGLSVLDGRAPADVLVLDRDLGVAGWLDAQGVPVTVE